MSPSKRQRGNQFQDRIKKFLESQGWTVHNQKSVATLIKVRGQEIWTSKRNDIFGCIDLVARKGGQTPLCIQATLDHGVSKRIKELEKIPWNLACENVQVWYGKPGGEIVIKIFNGVELIELGRILRGKFYSLEGGET